MFGIPSGMLFNKLRKSPASKAGDFLKIQWELGLPLNLELLAIPLVMSM